MEKITITIRLHGLLKEAAGVSTVQVSSRPTLADAILALRSKYPAVNAQMDAITYVVVLNGLSLLGKNLLEVTLADGDILTLFPFAAGG